MTTADDDNLKRSILAYHRPRGLLAIASIICFALCWWIGRVLNVPEALRLDPSLTTQASPVLNFLIIAVMLMICTVIGTLIAGTVRTDAGFFAACCGLAAFAIRFGPAGQVYREAAGTGVFIWLAFETALFFTLVSGAWLMQRWLHGRGLSIDDQIRDGMEAQTFPIAAKLLATATHAATTCLLLMMLLRSDDKAQALASVALASLVGSLVAHSLFGVTPGAWFWAGAGVAGVVGYCIGFFTPGDWIIGHPGSMLANAAPIDYAAAGPAGALIGYWMSRKWHAGRQYDALQKKAVIIVPSHVPRG